MRTSILVLSILFALPSQAAITDRAVTLQCPVVPHLLQGFLVNHVNYKKLDPDLENKTIEQFIEKLDGTKAYLLDSDVAQIRSALKGVFKKVGTDCGGMMTAHDILKNRVEDTVSYVKSILHKPDTKMDPNMKLATAGSKTAWIPDTQNDFHEFVKDTKLNFDPKMREWAKNSESAHELTMKLVQFQLSNYLATDVKLPEAKKQLEHRYELNLKRQKEMKPEEIYSLFIDSFATALDAHSGYLDASTLEDFEISMKLSLEGIGASLMWDDGYTTVDSLITGGSAERSGEVQPKDKIIAVAQGEGQFENVIDMPLRDVVKLIRGKKGTIVRLSILRQKGKDTGHVQVSLKRDKVALQDEAATLRYTNVKDGGKSLKIAILELPSFYGDLSKGTRSCYDDMKKLVLQAKKEKADALILDVSKNGGGLLTEAVRIVGLFIKKGNVVATQDSQGRMEILTDNDTDTEWSGPLALLTSRLSASASEIVSGALKDYDRALIIGGDHTFGKGTVQAMMNLPPQLGAVKVTTGMFFVPGGASTQYKGVEADVSLPSVFSTKEIGESSLENSLPPKTITQFKSGEINDGDPNKHWTPVSRALVEKLKGLSAARVEKNAEFKKIREEIAEAEATKNVISLEKSFQKQKEENAKGDKDKKKLGRHRNKRVDDEEYLKSPHVAEAVNVVADMVRLSGGERSAQN